MGYIFSYMKKFKFRITIQMIIKITGTLMDLILPWILAYLIDEIVPLKDIGLIYKYGLIMLFCAFIGISGNIIANRSAAKIARNVTTNLRHDLFSKIMNLSPKQIDDETIPSLVYRMSSDTYNVYHMIGMLQRIAVRAPILLIGGICLTFTLDPILTLVLLAILPFITLVAISASKKSIKYFNEVQKSNDQMITTARENATGIRVIKALKTEDYEIDRFDRNNLDVLRKSKKANITMAIVNPMLTLLLNIALCFIVLFGAYRVNVGETEPGKIVAFLSYVTIILNAMMTLTRIFLVLSKASASATRIKKILDLETGLEILEIEEKNSDYKIEFNNVSFSYLKVEDNLNDISFKVKEGESLGIIGATGSGKSTIINLLMRFYDCDKGEILIDGKNIKSYSLKDLRKKFGVVFQQDTLFSDSIYENIDFGRKMLFNNILESTKNAQAEEFIRELPDLYQTKLNARGTNLSGGQRQRILLSRALAGKNEILILDDSSSALDYKTDANLRSELNKISSTKIIIAQRISSIKHCQTIIVVDEGKIIDMGNHDYLMKNSSLYQLIYKTQMVVE